MTAVDQQKLQLLHQIQNHTLPFLNMLFLYIVWRIPFMPIAWKLDIYNFLTSPSAAFLTSIKLSPLALSILVAFYPLISLVVIVLFGYLVIQIVSLIVWGIKYSITKFQKVRPKAFLELTFPHDTAKSAYATEELYRLLHTPGNRVNEKRGYSLFIGS
jgi:hypothetical protein